MYVMLHLRLPFLYCSVILFYFCPYLQMDEGKTVILISKIQLLDNQSLVSAPLRPRNDYGSNDIPEMPWLDCDSVRCNCSKFPVLGNVIIHSVQVFSRNVETEVDEDEDEDTGNVSDDAPPASVDNDNDDNLDPAITLYTEYIKLKGCTYHDHFQAVLKSCKLRLQASSEINVRFFYEPANVADENAVVAQVLQDQEWVPIGYIPGKKVQKVLAALQSSSIKVIKFKKIEYSYIWSISAFKYIPTLIVIKEGRWPRDNENYSYNV